MAVLKGNAVVGQSGGPTVVINQSLVGVIEAVKQTPEIKNLYGAVHGVKGILSETFIDLLKETPETLERVARTPAAGLGSVRKKVTREECQRIFEIFKKRDVRYFFYIGGNDSAETANIISELAQESNYDLRTCHVPKTIDNDLRETDHCPGYGSAAKFVAQAFMGDNFDNRSLGGVKINVVMGRNAGFLTAAARLARKDHNDAPHLIYVPERSFDIEQFLTDVSITMDAYGRCVVAVSEGIHDEKDDPIYKSGEVDSHGNVQLSGSGALGDYLANLVKTNLGKNARVRADTLGYMQRSFPGCVSEVDAEEARRAGRDGVKYITTSDKAGGSVIFKRLGNGKDYAVETVLTDLKNLAKYTKDLEGKYISSSGNDINENYLEYLTPLVGTMPELGKFKGFEE